MDEEAIAGFGNATCRLLNQSAIPHWFLENLHHFNRQCSRHEQQQEEKEIPTTDIDNTFPRKHFPKNFFYGKVVKNLCFLRDLSLTSSRFRTCRHSFQCSFASERN